MYVRVCVCVSACVLYQILTDDYFIHVIINRLRMECAPTVSLSSASLFDSRISSDLDDDTRQLYPHRKCSLNVRNSILYQRFRNHESSNRKLHTMRVCMQNKQYIIKYNSARTSRKEQTCTFFIYVSAEIHKRRKHWCLSLFLYKLWHKHLPKIY